MRRLVYWWDREQIALYVAAILFGGVFGILAPGAAPVLSGATNPALSVLLFATFLGVPLIEVGRSFQDVRFLGAVLVVNFVIVPLVVWGLSRFVADDQGLLIGVLLVLLTPCVDYVIVFTGLAGGAKARLLAATPLLMLLQIVLLPAYLWLFADGETAAHIEIEPFVEAFVVIIALPLLAAAIVQAISRRHRAGRAIEHVMAGAMVPLMMLTLAVVIGSQIAAVGEQALTLLRVIAVAFFALAAYVTASSLLALILRTDVEHSTLGIIITALSVIVMPFLSFAERRAGRELGSATAVADSKQTLICTYLSAAVLIGLVLNSLLGWWWADAIAGLVIAGFAVREGIEAWRGDACATSVGMLLEDEHDHDHDHDHEENRHEH